nr:divergent polysaccharide deacetylase family protein [Maritimibacter sp. DP1N21-5]
MAVVLIDSGPERAEVGDVALMPFPLSVAVDASQPDVETAIDFYRANNAEVVLIVPFPPGATATDVDVTMQAYEPLLDRVVAIMVPESVGFQNAGEAATQLATVLGEKGLGLLTYPEGLNTGHKTAVSAGVPATLVFRDLDAEGQSPDVIRRFLDNVAFRARNEEGTVAVARVRPDSLQALLEWSLGNRAQTVNFAPLSALLLEQM